MCTQNMPKNINMYIKLTNKLKNEKSITKFIFYFLVTAAFEAGTTFKYVLSEKDYY